MVKRRYIGDGHPTFHRNPYNGYINPYYWVDDHPLLYGNNGSLDPGTHILNLGNDQCIFLLKIYLYKIQATLPHGMPDLHIAETAYIFAYRWNQLRPETANAFKKLIDDKKGPFVINLDHFVEYYVSTDLLIHL